jgi:hypothetical protein
VRTLAKDETVENGDQFPFAESCLVCVGAKNRAEKAIKVTLQSHCKKAIARTLKVLTGTGTVTRTVAVTVTGDGRDGDGRYAALMSGFLQQRGRVFQLPKVPSQSDIPST